MQTFAPKPTNSFYGTFGYLDPNRKRKNLIESCQIYGTVFFTPILKTSRDKQNRGDHWRGYTSHPANQMWQDSQEAFGGYILDNWRNLIDNNQLRQDCQLSKDIRWAVRQGIVRDTHKKPAWWGDENFHNSHAEALRWKGEWVSRVYLTSFLLNISKKSAALEMWRYGETGISKKDFLVKFQKTSTTSKHVIAAATINDFYRERLLEFKPTLNYVWPKG